jgi:[ribosomal protein S18]-alanine N-acetyltransferase
MKIVRAAASHLPAVAALMASSALLRRYGVTRRGARASLAEARRARELLLVALGPDVVGFAWVIATRALDRSAYLRLLLVAERRRSAGIGDALLSAAERLARRNRARHLVLLVTKTNRRARSFYERHGYRHIGDLRRFVRPTIDEALYAKDLRS